MTLAEKIIQFNASLRFDNSLSDGIRVLNPYADNPLALATSTRFYQKFYSDNNKRKLILGINPGRFGAGVTGIPFTDTKRLEEKCGLSIEDLTTYEPSSVFVYDVIEAYGGVEKFYHDYYISSVCPLGFVKFSENGKEINYNYYDSKELMSAAEPFIIESIENQLAFGLDTKTCYCLGNNKNYKFLMKLNQKKNYFKNIVPLEHPRFIMQYKSKKKEEYVAKFIGILR